jgi:hypothetical protein
MDPPAIIETCIAGRSPALPATGAVPSPRWAAETQASSPACPSSPSHTGNNTAVPLRSCYSNDVVRSDRAVARHRRDPPAIIETFVPSRPPALPGTGAVPPQRRVGDPLEGSPACHRSNAVPELPCDHSPCAHSGVLHKPAPIGDAGPHNDRFAQKAMPPMDETALPPAVPLSADPLMPSLAPTRPQPADTLVHLQVSAAAADIVSPVPKTAAAIGSSIDSAVGSALGHALDGVQHYQRMRGHGRVVDDGGDGEEGGGSGLLNMPHQGSGAHSGGKLPGQHNVVVPDRAKLGGGSQHGGSVHRGSGSASGEDGLASHGGGSSGLQHKDSWRQGGVATPGSASQESVHSGGLAHPPHGRQDAGMYAQGGQGDTAQHGVLAQQGSAACTGAALQAGNMSSGNTGASSHHSGRPSQDAYPSLKNGPNHGSGSVSGECSLQGGSVYDGGSQQSGSVHGGGGNQGGSQQGTGSQQSEFAYGGGSNQGGRRHGTGSQQSGSAYGGGRQQGGSVHRLGGNQQSGSIHGGGGNQGASQHGTGSQQSGSVYGGGRQQGGSVHRLGGNQGGCVHGGGGVQGSGGLDGSSMHGAGSKQGTPAKSGGVQQVPPYGGAPQHGMHLQHVQAPASHVPAPAQMHGLGQVRPVLDQS